MGCGASSGRVHELELENERLRTEKRGEDAVVGARKPTWELGVTLGFLYEFLQQLDEELDHGLFQGNYDFTTNDLVEKFIKLAVKERQCRYVDLIPSEYVKPPTVFVSHRWKGGFRHLVERLLSNSTSPPMFPLVRFQSGWMFLRSTKTRTTRPRPT